MIQKLRIKFICVTMAIVTVMMCVIFGLVIHFTAQALERESLQMLRSVAAGRFQLERPAGDSGQFYSPYFVVTLSPLGQIIDLRGGYPALEQESWISGVMTDAIASGGQSGVLADYSLRFYRSSDRIGELFVFADITTEQDTLRMLAVSCVLIGLAGFVAFGAASFFLAGWMVKPVEEAWKEQRQFVADASHELKTPLAVIMTNAELLQNPDYDPGQQAQFSHSILTVSRQMRTLVEGLLELARVDNGAVRAAFAPVDLSALAEEELLPWEPLYFEQGLTLESSIDPGVTVTGSADHLRQVFSILLDNARKYSTDGGHVQITLKRQGTAALLGVENPGCPISPADLTNIFKRFYRVDKARSNGSGYGLGLSIAQQITMQHGGKIWAESQDGRNRFFVQIPLSR